MRVLFVSSLWPPAVLGGAETYAARLAHELRERGHDVGVLTLGVDGADVVASVPAWPYRLEEYVDQPAWKKAVFHARDVYDPVTARVLARAIRSYGPDVVHSHSVAGLSSAALAAPSAGRVPHVHHLHDYWLLCARSSFTRRGGAACDRQCPGCVGVRWTRDAVLRRHGPDVFLAVSAAVAAAHAGVPWMDGRVRVMPLPLDPPAAPRRPRSDGPFTFGFLGQLAPEKGIRTLLKAFAALPDDGCRLLVAGRGALASEVSGPGVTALGWVTGDQLESFWASIDCLVVPSEWPEPGGLVAVEARGRGVPVIASSAGDLRRAWTRRPGR